MVDQLLFDFRQQKKVTKNILFVTISEVTPEQNSCRAEPCFPSSAPAVLYFIAAPLVGGCQWVSSSSSSRVSLSLLPRQQRFSPCSHRSAYQRPSKTPQEPQETQRPHVRQRPKTSGDGKRRRKTDRKTTKTTNERTDDRERRRNNTGSQR